MLSRREMLATAGNGLGMLALVALISLLFLSHQERKSSLAVHDRRAE